VQLKTHGGQGKCTYAPVFAIFFPGPGQRFFPTLPSGQKKLSVGPEGKSRQQAHQLPFSPQTHA